MSQTVAGRLTAAMQKLVADEQMKHALISLCVVNAKTGETVYRYNDQVGMAPASTQKLFTSAAAFEMLGSGYQYLTTLSYSGKDGMLNVLGSGDPSLGSWRFSETSRIGILTRWVENLKTVVRVNGISGIRVHDGESGSLLSIPEGYIWQDIGNYYGA
ncbi:MAG: D-alanyl-D-alanine carboxypeptidase, partial [Gemmatimonadaceae bacterium]|nr:D-alanyl-D-alanine carboxypeptidase [Chitinophagaceae bacterium]